MNDHYADTELSLKHYVSTFYFCVLTEMLCVKISISFGPFLHSPCIVEVHLSIQIEHFKANLRHYCFGRTQKESFFILSRFL